MIENNPNPEKITKNEWKNRYLVSGKLTPMNFQKFRNYCKKNNYNYNSGLNHLIANHPLLKLDV